MKLICLLIIIFFTFNKSYQYFKNNQIHKALILIILGGFLLRGWCVPDIFLCDWDERFHALVAKHLPFFCAKRNNPLKTLPTNQAISNFDFN